MSNPANKARPDLFTHTLNNLRTGEAQELSQELAELIEAVRHTNKQGTISLTLKVKPEGEGMYGIESDIRSKKPTLPRGKSIFWGTPEGNLVTSDPAQGTLALKTVDTTDDTSDQPLRQVGS